MNREAVTSALALAGIEFRSAEAADFPTLTVWLAERHVRKFYQKTPVTLRQVMLEYGPIIRGDEPTICHLATSDGKPFAYLQCYRNADYPEWGETIGVYDGISVDLFIGEPAYLGKGFGRTICSPLLRHAAGRLSRITPERCAPTSPTRR